MKFKLLAVFILLCGTCATLFGQDIAGTWQGSLKASASELRVVFKIARAPDNQFTGQTFSIDQGGQPIPVNAITKSRVVIKCFISQELCFSTWSAVNL